MSRDFSATAELLIYENVQYYFTLLRIFIRILCEKCAEVGVMTLSAVANHLRLVRLNHVDQFILSYGGLRGAIAFALASLLDRHQFCSTRDLFITTTIAIVYFTNFVMVSSSAVLTYL